MWVWHDACVQVQTVQTVVPAEQYGPFLLPPKDRVVNEGQQIN